MARKLPDLVLLAIFILVISIPLATPLPDPAKFWDQPSTPQSGYSTALLAKAAVDFPPAFSAYFEDHHLLHQQLVDVLQSIRFHLLRETVFPNVLIGKADWLYYTGENNIADFECTSPFSAMELQTIRTRLLDWNDQLAMRGVKFYIVIAPNKETIYPQYLPDQIKPGGKACRIDQVMRELQTTQLAVLDLRAPIQAAARDIQVYHRTDTHWNAVGALLATREILSLLKQDFPQLALPSLDDFQEKMQPFSGDLAAFLPSDERFIEQSAALVPIIPSQMVLEEGADRSIISSIPGSDLPRALVFRDSFSDALIPFLSEHFSRIVFAHSFSVDLDLVDQEKPDIVIYEVAQRYLTVLR
jgi:hypothetical protein